MSELEGDKYGVEPLSNFDLINIVAKDLKDRLNIVDLRNTTHLEKKDDIFHNTGHCILFVPNETSESEIGHWVALVQQNKNKTKNGKYKGKGKCIYFDSYGEDLPNHKINQILKKSFDKVEVNKKQYQQYNTNVCGYWSLLMICLNKLIPNMTLDDIHAFLKKKPKNIPYDKWVAIVLGEALKE